MFIGRTDVEAETPILWSPDAKSWLIGKDPDAGRDWGQEEKGMTEDEMAGWHHRLDAHEFGWTPGVGNGQGGLAWCDSWGRRESDTTEQLNWTELRGGSTSVLVGTSTAVAKCTTCCQGARFTAQRRKASGNWERSGQYQTLGHRTQRRKIRCWKIRWRVDKPQQFSKGIFIAVK